AAVVGRLLANGHLRVADDTGELVAARTRPHRHVDLRNGGATVVIRRRGGAVIGTIDAVRARFECHPGAVYLHHGAAFAVEDLDLAAGEARVREVSGESYTSALAEKETHILEPLEACAGHPPSGFGRLRVTE